MKTLCSFLLFVGLLPLSAQAQSYSSSSQTERLGYGYNTFPKRYYGFRVGLDYTHIGGKDSPEPDAFKLTSGRRSRLNIGFAYGRGLSKSAPIYIETGLNYVAKGGRATVDDIRRDYNLDYLELPLVLKYMYSVGSGFAFHVFFGGFFSCGIAGSIKIYDDEYSHHGSFSDRDDSFRRFDAGLRFGLGASFEIIYLEFAYDLGLANISHDPFFAAHNRGAILNIGVNF